MSCDFSAYVRSLGPGGEPPDSARFEELLDTLRGALVHEMKKRALWSAPPSFLGIYGGNHWSEGDLLEDLLLDCYQFIFLRRLPGLKKQLMVRHNVDGLIFLNIRNFLHEIQKRHDPLGFRIFELVHSAVGRLLADGVLHVLDGDPKIRNHTVLGFSAWNDPQQARGVDLHRQVEAWTDELLPELVTAWSKDDVLARLETMIARLPDDGVEVFRLRDLIEPLKDDVRARWHAIRRSEEGEMAVEDENDERVSLVPLVTPDRELEERQSFQTLLACMARGLGGLRESEKTKDYLRRLLLFLRSWAAESALRSGEDEAVANPAELAGERLPSDKKLGELLRIPRGRIQELKATLGLQVETCREAISGKAAALPFPGAVAAATRAHAQEAAPGPASRRERLRIRTAEVAARWARERAAIAGPEERSPRPGDTFVFAETSACPVEWAVLERDPAGAQRLLVVPVDENPLVGSRDVAAGDGATDGVAHLRCAQGVGIDVDAFTPELRTGVLNPEMLERARCKRAEIEAGTLRASFLEEETDADPEYQRWLEMLGEAQARLPGNPQPWRSSAPQQSEAPAPVVSIADHGRRRRASPPRFGGASRPWYALAAGLAAAALGLSLWVGQLRHRVDELSGPIVISSSPAGELRFHDTTRGSVTLTLPATATHAAIYLILSQVEPHPAYRLQLLERDRDEAVWESTTIAHENELLLAVPRGLLTSAEYRLRLYGRDEEGVEVLLDEQALRIEIR